MISTPSRFKNAIAAITILLLVCAQALSQPAELLTEIHGRIVGVHDGDSATLLTAEKSEVKIRLEGIDAPELKQPFGTASKQALSNLIFGKPVSVRVTGKDRYGRTLGRISAGATDINHTMVATGMAWHYKKYSKDNELAEAQAAAMTARRGLWGGPTPVPPWDWRKPPKAK